MRAWPAPSPHGRGARGQRYDRPVAKLRSYLDELDTAQPPVPPDERILAALGPKVLQLSADQRAGTTLLHEHGPHRRGPGVGLGPAAQLLPDQKVLFCTDPSPHTPWPNAWRSTWGCRSSSTTSAACFDDCDSGDGGTRRPARHARGLGLRRCGGGPCLKEHLDAGATEVLAQVLTAEDAAPGTPPLDAWRHAAEVLFGS